MQSKFEQVFYHYTQATKEMEKRKTRKNGWDDIIKAYYSVLPKNWKYNARVTDPLIRTTLQEKTGRMINNKLKGKVVPREGGDVVKAKLQNAVLDYQWDQATCGGTMIEKWIQMDTQTRLFGSSFGLTYWDKRVEGDKVLYEGNEFKVLDNRDVLLDYTASHVRDAKWVQVREFVSLEDLEKRGIYNLSELKAKIDKKISDTRDTAYTSMTKTIRGLEDQVGRDLVNPVLEIVTEYRPDEWITIVPRHGVTILESKNPYNTKKIPVIQLRYYSTGDDIYGESEVEPVLPIARAINSLLSGAIDEVDISLRPPVKIAQNSTVRLDTIVYGPNALWLTGDSVNNVIEHQVGGQGLKNFETLYFALKSAFNNAMGELSAGVNNNNPFTNDKTATEVNASVKQGQVRDQYNQIFLEEALKEQMLNWITNNQQFLFSDPSQQHKVIRIVGQETLKELKELGLSDMTHDEGAMQDITQMISSTEGQVDPLEIEMLMQESEVPQYPVVLNKNEKDPMKMDIRPKMEMDKEGKYASVYLEKDDFDGLYDYVPSVKSMNVGVSDAEMFGRTQALDRILNPQVQQQLQLEGTKVRIKELLAQVLEDSGVKNAERLFEDATQQAELGAIPESGLGSGGAIQNGGMEAAGAMGANAGQQQVPQPQEIPQQGIGSPSLY